MLWRARRANGGCSCLCCADAARGRSWRRQAWAPCSCKVWQERRTTVHSALKRPGSKISCSQRGYSLSMHSGTGMSSKFRPLFGMSLLFVMHARKSMCSSRLTYGWCSGLLLLNNSKRHAGVPVTAIRSSSFSVNATVCCSSACHAVLSGFVLCVAHAVRGAWVCRVVQGCRVWWMQQ
ncbi:hypothetical protein COO60DRAFT_929641 [Scenedesmus sp. NREL 46B-D3]|nr:hypothetical protein COO60DRAFT_929641 [Scenedesmus sp. NREL 46B-D3]